MGQHGTKHGVLVYLPEQLHRWLKAKAALEGKSLSAVVEEAARTVYPDAPADDVSTANETAESYRAMSDRTRRSARMAHRGGDGEAR